MIQRFFTLLAAGILFCACKKEQSETTCSLAEQPGDYFPAFAGSYWHYSDQNGNTVTYTIAGEYEFNHQACRPIFENLQLCVSDNALISDVYAGMGATYAYNSWIWSTIPDSTRYCFVSFSTLTITNSTFNSYPRYTRTAVVVDTTLTVPNFPTFPRVLVMEEFDAALPVHRYLDYFAEDVGLVRRDSINGSDTVTLLTLDSYHIGQ